MPGPGIELIGEEEIASVVEVLRSRHLSRYGSEDDPNFKAKVATFERTVAELSNVRYAVAVNCGTTALWVSMLGLDIGPGDEVIVPGYTFIASISAIMYARAVPILAEIDRTFNLDPADVERKLTPRTKAIMAVHMLGSPARVDELKAIADRHGLFLIEDCAQAFGARYKGRPVGSIGDVGAFSFNHVKIITAGEGGLIVTDNEEHYKRYFALHDQGHSPLRKGKEIGLRPFVGMDFRMSELLGAVLLAQVQKLDYIRERLHSNKRLFKSLIRDLPGLEFRELPDPEGEMATLLTVILPDAEIAQDIARDLDSKLAAEGGWHVYSHMEPILQKRMVVPRGCPFDCPSTYDQTVEYYAGMLPQTDELLARSLHISIGVLDRGLGSGFGVTIRDGAAEVEARAAQFCKAAEKYL